MGYLVVIWR